MPIFATLAPAKVNLFLHVGAPDGDGYHPLCSLMVFADLGDELQLEMAEAFDLRITGPFGEGLDAGPSNLVWRAAAALAEAAGVATPSVRLTLDKRLPVASGLGGGSSDAGAAMRLLRQALALDIDNARLEAAAARLGADGAACLWARPTLAEDRGERLSAAPDLPPLWAVLANCGAPVSTPAVYGALDRLGGFGDIAPPAPPRFADAAGLAAWLADQRNDLEGPALATAPQIGAVLSALAAAPETLLARVSGSGGTCFSLCAGPSEAAALARRLQAEQPMWWVRDCRLGAPQL